MPNIFKKRQFMESEEAVEIPDAPFASMPEAEENGMPEGDEASYDGAGVIPATPKFRRLTREELEERYADELKELRRDVAEQAYSDAIQQKKGELKDCIAQVKESLDELQEMQDAFAEQYSQELKFLAIDIAEKVMLLRIEEDDMSLSALVLQTVSTMRRSKWLSVDLSERLVNLVGFMAEEVKKPEYHGRAEINPMACPDDTVRVNTEDGTVVASVSLQINKLREAFSNADRE